MRLASFLGETEVTREDPAVPCAAVRGDCVDTPEGTSDADCMVDFPAVRGDPVDLCGTVVDGPCAVDLFGARGEPACDFGGDSAEAFPGFCKAPRGGPDAVLDNKAAVPCDGPDDDLGSTATAPCDEPAAEGLPDTLKAPSEPDNVLDDIVTPRCDEPATETFNGTSNPPFAGFFDVWVCADEPSSIEDDEVRVSLLEPSWAESDGILNFELIPGNNTGVAEQNKKTVP